MCYNDCIGPPQGRPFTAEEYKLVVCDNCGDVYYATEAERAEFPKLEIYDRKVFDSSKYPAYGRTFPTRLYGAE